MPLTITDGATATAVAAALQAQHPEAYAAIAATGGTDKAAAVEAARKEAHAAGRQEGMAEGIATETQRVASVFAVSLPGHEKLIQALALDGKTTGGEAAAQIIAAEKKGGADYLKGAGETEANKIQGGQESQTGKRSVDARALAAEARALVDAEAAKGNKMTISAAVRMIQGGKS